MSVVRERRSAAVFDPDPAFSGNPASPAEDTPFSCSIAESRAEYDSAFRLIYQAYVRNGMIEPNPYQLRVTPFHLLATTTVFIARIRSEIICTVSLVGDGELGLPMEAIHREEIARLRAEGRHVGEVSCLADRRQDFSRTLPVFIQLTRLMAQFARRRGIDVLAIAVRPKHGRFYQRFMGFDLIGEERAYPSVCGTRGVACCLDFIKIDRERPACYDQYFGRSLPLAELSAQPMSAEDREYFEPAAAFANGFPTLAQD